MIALRPGKCARLAKDVASAQDDRTPRLVRARRELDQAAIHDKKIGAFVARRIQQVTFAVVSYPRPRADGP